MLPGPCFSEVEPADLLIRTWEGLHPRPYPARGDNALPYFLHQTVCCHIVGATEVTGATTTSPVRWQLIVGGRTDACVHTGGTAESRLVKGAI